MKTMYDKLKETIKNIHLRYKDPLIIIGGDFNDKVPPTKIENVELKPLRKYTRLNYD